MGTVDYIFRSTTATELSYRTFHQQISEHFTKVAAYLHSYETEVLRQFPGYMKKLACSKVSRIKYCCKNQLQPFENMVAPIKNSNNFQENCQCKNTLLKKRAKVKQDLQLCYLCVLIHILGKLGTTLLPEIKGCIC